MTTYGYIRVSSRDQCEERQIIALRDFGVLERNMVVEKQSGKDFERPLYRALLRRLRSGDTLVIKSIDRLGRNYEEILEQWRYLTKHMKVSISVIDMPLLDTNTGRDLTGTLISDIVLQLLSYVAQTERENIRQRQAEGIAAAKARGVSFGRPRTDVPPEFPEFYEQWRAGLITSRQAARALRVSQGTFLSWSASRDALQQKNNPPIGGNFLCE